MKILKQFIKTGISKEADFIERRRIRLLNIFILIAIAVILGFVLLNLLVKDWYQAALILSGLIIIVLPVIILNYKKKTDVARYYFVSVSLFFLLLTSLKPTLAMENRDNEFFFIGFLSLVVVLIDNPQKVVFFIITALFTVGLKLLRFSLSGEEWQTANTMSIGNLIISFICIYFFTSSFKSDLIKSKERTDRLVVNLKKQKAKISDQSFEVERGRRLLRQTIDNMPVFMALVDLQGCFVLANKKFEEVVEFSVDALIGKHYSEVFSTKNSKMIQPLFDRAKMGKEAIIDGFVTFRNGDKIYALGKYIPLKNEFGHVTGILAYVSNIKQLKDAENELKAIDHTKNKILSILSHDLRTPLNSLSSLISMSEHLTQEEWNTLVGKVKYQVDALGFTLHNMLIWAKSQLGGFEAVKDRIKINDIVSNCVELYEQALIDKKIKTTIKIDDEVYATIDPDNLALVTRNFLSNAIKFTKSGGHIMVKCKEDESYTVLEIEDNGLGMSQEKQKELLGEFTDQKMKSSLGTDGEKGTGLGLQFCKDMLILNEAELYIESEEDKGTKVIVHMKK